MAEGARLESVYTRKCIEGSNPSLTAKFKEKAWIRVQAFFFAWRTAERGEKPRQGSTKRPRFGPQTAARRERLPPYAAEVPLFLGSPRTASLIFSPFHDF